MRKVITLIIIVISVFFAGCSNTNEVEELRKEMAYLELEQLLLEEGYEIISSNSNENVITKEMIEILTSQTMSSNYEDWNSVAMCDYATEAHLIVISNKCSNIISNYNWTIEIATNLCENPASTGKVIKELSNSTWYEVWNIAAKSLYADEETLIIIAQNCSNMLKNERYAKRIATSLCENPACTSAVLEQLEKSNCNSIVTMAKEKLEIMK